MIEAGEYCCELLLGYINQEAGPAVLTINSVMCSASSPGWATRPHNQPNTPDVQSQEFVVSIAEVLAAY